MTITFLNRKARQNSARLAPKVRRGLSSPHHLRPMSMHRHPCLNDMPKPAATLQLKKTSGTVRVPPETYQVRDFPYRESHTDHDARCVKTRSESRLSTVRLRDFSAGVCQLHTPFPTCQELLLTYDRAQRAHHALLAASHKRDRLPYMEGTPKLRHAGTSKDLKASQMLRLKRRHLLSRE